jgi:hypothetical protein
MPPEEFRNDTPCQRRNQRHSYSLEIDVFGKLFHFGVNFA